MAQQLPLPTIVILSEVWSQKGRLGDELDVIFSGYFLFPFFSVCISIGYVYYLGSWIAKHSNSETETDYDKSVRDDKNKQNQWNEGYTKNN